MHKNLPKLNYHVYRDYSQYLEYAHQLFHIFLHIKNIRWHQTPIFRYYLYLQYHYNTIQYNVIPLSIFIVPYQSIHIQHNTNIFLVLIHHIIIVQYNIIQYGLDYLYIDIDQHNLVILQSSSMLLRWLSYQFRKLNKYYKSKMIIHINLILIIL